MTKGLIILIVGFVILIVAYIAAVIWNEHKHWNDPDPMSEALVKYAEEHRARVAVEVRRQHNRTVQPSRPKTHILPNGRILRRY